MSVEQASISTRNGDLLDTNGAEGSVALLADARILSLLELMLKEMESANYKLAILLENLR